MNTEHILLLTRIATAARTYLNVRDNPHGNYVRQIKDQNVCLIELYEAVRELEKQDPDFDWLSSLDYCKNKHG